VSLVTQLFSRSLSVFHLGGSACNNCDIEILDALTPKYDLERFGITLAPSIRQTDMILLSGIFNKKSAVRARRLYEHAPKPVLVVAIGGCPATGLIFRDSYNWDRPPGEYIPIDAYVPGCPPKPEAIIAAIVKVIGAIRRGELTLASGAKAREAPVLPGTPVPSPEAERGR
jgi:Ni,Fe-hydrogenase III small subunit